MRVQLADCLLVVVSTALTYLAAEAAFALVGLRYVPLRLHGELPEDIRVVPSHLQSPALELARSDLARATLVGWRRSGWPWLIGSTGHWPGYLFAYRKLTVTDPPSICHTTRVRNFPKNPVDLQGSRSSSP